MKLAGVTPLEHFLIVEAPTEKERTTKSGLIIQENEHDYLLNSKVVRGNKLYPTDSHVVFHVIDMDSAFKDAASNEGFILIHQDKIRGLYDPEA